MRAETPSDDAVAKAKALIRQHDLPAAIALLQERWASDSGDCDALELLGMAHFMSGDLVSAREAFEKLTREDSMRVNGWVNLGAVLNRLGEFKKASEALRRALQKNRRCAEAYYNMGIAQKGLNLTTMAMNAYKEAIKMDPSMVDAQMNLGKLFAEASNINKATQCFQAVLKQDPGNQKARLLLDRMQAVHRDARKTESPFGRLVDLEVLDRQNSAVRRRVMEPAERNHEREFIREVTRKIRHDARDLIPLLDGTLHECLHRLQVVALQSEARTASPETHADFLTTIASLRELRNQLATGFDQIQEHLQGHGELDA